MRLKNCLHKHCDLCLWISLISILLRVSPYCHAGCKYFCSFCLLVSSLSLALYFFLSYFHLFITFPTWFISFLFLSIIQLGIFFFVLLPLILLPCLVYNRANRTDMKVLTKFWIVLQYCVNEFLFVSNVVFWKFIFKFQQFYFFSE